MDDAPTCSRCHTPMQPGQAIAPTLIASEPDMPGSETVTLNPGPGRLVTCRKCPGCGHSVTENKR